MEPYVKINLYANLFRPFGTTTLNGNFYTLTIIINQSVLNVVYQSHGSAIDRYAADGVGEICRGQQG